MLMNFSLLYVFHKERQAYNVIVCIFVCVYFCLPATQTIKTDD